MKTKKGLGELMAEAGKALASGPLIICDDEKFKCPYCKKEIKKRRPHEYAEMQTMVFGHYPTEFYFRCLSCKKVYSVIYEKKIIHGEPQKIPEGAVVYPSYEI